MEQSPQLKVFGETGELDIIIPSVRRKKPPTGPTYLDTTTTAWIKNGSWKIAQKEPEWITKAAVTRYISWTCLIIPT